MENRPARHIGEIISERNNRAVDAVGATPSLISNPTFRVQQIGRVVFSGVLVVLAAIGWFVMLPFITRDGDALTSREKSRG